MKNLFILFFIFFLEFSYAQEKYPKDVFRPPLDIPIILSGNFGELRSNHFHSGIDIKTQQREGLPVYAIGDGSISRIKISLWGYGKALYITHPNGYTSVYAHLQKFAPKIEAYIKKLQYQKKSYEVQTFPKYGELTLNKGEIIAYSGNTGSSAGPHLHFEIRSSISEKPTNPLFYGLKVKDATKPTLLNLYGYPLTNNSQINQSNDKVKINFTKQSDGSYIADKVYALGTIGFGINGYDMQDLAINKNGIYAVKQTVNGKTYTDFDFKTFSFTESKYINTIIDYNHYGTYNQRILKCFKTDSNKLSIYNTLYNNGKIPIKEGLLYNVEIILKDLENNITKIKIPVDGKKQELKVIKKNNKTPNYIVAKKPNNYNLEAAKVYFPANTFYDDFYIDLKKGKDTVAIHNNTVPARKSFTITFNTAKYSSEERKKLFIAKLDKELNPSYATTYKRGAIFSTKTKNLGTYTLAKDTIAPIITAKNFKDKQLLANYKKLTLKITDDLSGINTYNATLNGEWILMEYYKNTLTYNFDDKILNKKECNLKVVVTDNVGNTTTFTATLYKK